VEGLTREPETAVRADRGTHAQELSIGPDAASDVAEVVLEGTDGDRELVAEVVERPLRLAEQPNDFLAAISGE